MTIPLTLGPVHHLRLTGICCVERGLASVGYGRSAGHMTSASSLNAVASRSCGGTSVAIS
jgi:hypothetical protein